MQEGTLYEGVVLPECLLELLGYTQNSCLGVRRMRAIFGVILLISSCCIVMTKINSSFILAPFSKILFGN
jgi:hypothetical protein